MLHGWQTAFVAPYSIDPSEDVRMKASRVEEKQADRRDGHIQHGGSRKEQQLL